MAISVDRFDAQFAHFRDSVRRASPNGLDFRSFQDGLAAQWEDYEPRLRNRALSLLNKAGWREDSIGQGVILNNVIASIEMEGGYDRNNLVRWENRFGHLNRSHYALLDARLDNEHRSAFERLFFDLFLDRSDEATVFERLCSLAGRRYDLLAYLFFLKDMNRFMPIATRTFDEAFELLGIDLVTTGRCSWENYTGYNNALADVQSALRERADLPGARLIDAHYEPSNLQVVCRFVNFWKSDSDNEEFRRLLALVRGNGGDDAGGPPPARQSSLPACCWSGLSAFPKSA